MANLQRSSLAKEIKRLREELATRRSALGSAQATLDAQNFLPAPLALAEFLDPAGSEEGSADIVAEEPTAVVRHGERMAELERELLEEEKRCGRLRNVLTELQIAAAADTRNLAEQLRMAQPALHAVVPAADGTLASDQKAFDALLEEKRAIAANLEAQAEQAEALVRQAHARRAAEARRAATLAARARALSQGAQVHRWDSSSRMLRPCRIALVAEGRCFQCIEEHAGDEAPLLMPLHRLESVSLTTATTAFGDASIPSHPWLYFTVSWRRHAGNNNVVVRSPESARVAHFACNSRAECATWVLGLLEAANEALSAPASAPSSFKKPLNVDNTPGARAGESGAESTGGGAQQARLGVLLWQQMRAMVEEQARETGKRPLRVLAAAVRSAALDMKSVKVTDPSERVAVSMFMDMRVQRAAASNDDGARTLPVDSVASRGEEPAVRRKRRPRVGEKAKRRPPQAPAVLASPSRMS
jgi:hypothetical protein